MPWVTRWPFRRRRMAAPAGPRVPDPVARHWVRLPPLSWTVGLRPPVLVPVLRLPTVAGTRAPVRRLVPLRHRARVGAAPSGRVCGLATTAPGPTGPGPEPVAPQDFVAPQQPAPIVLAPLPRRRVPTVARPTPRIEFTTVTAEHVGEPVAPTTPFRNLCEFDRLVAQYEGMDFGSALSLAGLAGPASAPPPPTASAPVAEHRQQARPPRRSLAESRRLGIGAPQPAAGPTIESTVDEPGQHSTVDDPTEPEANVDSTVYVPAAPEPDQPPPVDEPPPPPRPLRGWGLGAPLTEPVARPRPTGLPHPRPTPRVEPPPTPDEPHQLLVHPAEPEHTTGFTLPGAEPPEVPPRPAPVTLPKVPARPVPVTLPDVPTRPAPVTVPEEPTPAAVAPPEVTARPEFEPPVVPSKRPLAEVVTRPAHEPPAVVDAVEPSEVLGTWATAAHTPPRHRSTVVRRPGPPPDPAVPTPPAPAAVAVPRRPPTGLIYRAAVTAPAAPATVPARRPAPDTTWYESVELPVPAELVGAFTAQLGADVGDVPVHRGRAVSRRAHSVGARAFTQDAQVFLPDEAGPLDALGTRALLAHELVHAVQQRVLGSRLPTEDSAHGQELEAAAVAAEQWVRGDGPAPRVLVHRPTEPAEARTAPLQRAEPEHTAPDPVAPPQAWTPSTGFTTPAEPPHPVNRPTVDTPPHSAPAHQPGPAPAQSPVDNTPELDQRFATVNAALAELRQRAPAPDLDDPRTLDALAARLYRFVRTRLRAELVVDRERAGVLADPV